MKKVLIFAASLLCLVGCGEKENPNPKEEDKFQAKLVIEWKQSDNIVPYTDPKIAYLVPGASVVTETPSNKEIVLKGEKGRVELSFFSGTTDKDIAELVENAKDGDKVSYYCFASLQVECGDSFSTKGSSFSVNALSQSNLKSLSADDLKLVVFDEFNSAEKYNPEDRKTNRYQNATGKQRKLVFTWEKVGDEVRIDQAYEKGNLFSN